MAENDPFAAFRDRPAEVSKSYRADLALPAETQAGLHETPNVFNDVTPETPLPLENQATRGWREYAAELVAGVDMPPEWATGVAALKFMGMPDGATEWRWRQIVDDAERFAIRCHGRAIETGWTIDDVFGFDPDDEETSFGLVVEIRGGRPVVLDDGVISVLMTDGARRWFYPGKAKPGVPPIWAINRNRRARERARAEQ